ncbi:MAG: hypothetical protein C0508_27470, partial [Cyanobacteria bacterium PR.023]|nr:hypothetical protein [Cyanobacteria bacterium PR.023]
MISVFVRDPKLSLKLSLFLALLVAGFSSPAHSLPVASQSLASAKAKTTKFVAPSASPALIKELEAKVLADPKNAESHLLLG